MMEQEDWKDCPECGLKWYLYYSDKDSDEHIELPVVIATPFGWLCRVCRYEWQRNGEPVNQEEVEELIKKWRGRTRRDPYFQSLSEKANKEVT